MMENPEEILHSLEEFAKMKPKDIPRELEEYLMFVAKTGDPIYQWGSIKSLFREKLINVITEFYETCPVMEIPPCPNVDIFNYDLMKNFILEKLEAFSSAPFTLQRICELLTTPRKEYNRIDKFMRALEKNILVVSTVEPGGRRSNENGDGIMNGIETEPPVPEPGAEINIEEMDESPSWGPEIGTNHVSFEGSDKTTIPTTNQECIISCTIVGNQPYVSIEPLPTEALPKLNVETTQETEEESSGPVEEDVVDKAISESEKIQEVVISENFTKAIVETKIPEVSEPSEVQKILPDIEEESKMVVSDKTALEEPKMVVFEKIALEESEMFVSEKTALEESKMVVSEETALEILPETKEKSEMVISNETPLEVLPQTEAKSTMAVSEETPLEVLLETEEESKMVVSEETPLEVNKVEDKIKETILETPQIDTVLKETVSKLAEQVIVENISPETSTESPETLETAINDQGEKDIAEKIEVPTEKCEDMQKKVEKIEVDDKPTEETSTIEKVEECKKEEAITVETNKEMKKIEQLIEEVKEPNQTQVDIKVDVETVTTDIQKENEEKLVEKAEVAEELKPAIKTVKEIENVEIKTSQVEPMNVEETPEVAEIKADEKIDKIFETEIDPLQLDDITEDTSKLTEETTKITKVSEDIAVATEETKTETPKIEEKIKDTEETPMEVDIVEEVKASEPAEEPKPESINETEQKLENKTDTAETDQNKAKS